MIYQMGIIIIIIPVMTFLVYPHDDGFSLMGIVNDKFMGGIKKGIYQTKDGSYGTLISHWILGWRKLWHGCFLHQRWNNFLKGFNKCWNNCIMKSGVQHQENLWAFQKFIDTWTWVSCRFSLKPIHSWSSLWILNYSHYPLVRFNLWKITMSN